MTESISAVTLATHNMRHAVRFYRMLGFEIVHGDDTAAFTSFRVGTSYLNLTAQIRMLMRRATGGHPSRIYPIWAHP
jgi:hypothetical protein